TPIGKLKQVARAVQLELFYSKRQILEAYLNDAPYGGNVEGVGAASLIYFGHSAHSISLPEALALAVVPQNPGRFVRHGSSAISEIINRRLTASRNRLYARWLSTRPADAALKPLFTLPLTMHPVSSLPFEAPHGVEQVMQMQRFAGEGTGSR